MGTFVADIYEPAIGEVGWGTLVNANFSRLADLSYNVVAYGADPTGVADSTTAIQAAIDAATGAGSATVVRRTGATVYLPAGTYKVTAPLTVHSVGGMRIKGAGMASTKIQAAAAMSQVFELDGFALSEMSDMFIAGDSSHAVTRGVFYHWNNATSAGASYGSVFRNIYIEGASLLCDVGWAVGTDNGLEVDRSTWSNCFAVGGQTLNVWSDAKWQSGWQFGFNSANNLDHVMIECTSALWVNGVNITGSTLNVVGGEIQGNAVDFYHTNPSTGGVTVSCVRSENSGRLYYSAINGNPANVVLNGITWKSDYLNADNHVILFQTGGSMVVDGLYVFEGGSVKTPKILVGSTVGSKFHGRGLHIMNTTAATFVDNNDDAKGQWTIENYTQLDGTTGLTTAHTSVPFGNNKKALTYSATIATNAGTADTFPIVATNGTAFTISTPTNAQTGMRITYDIKNSSGGALGAITWGVAFLLGGAFTNPANGKRRTISFYYDGTNWVETNRAAADI